MDQRYEHITSRLGLSSSLLFEGVPTGDIDRDRIALSLEAVLAESVQAGERSLSDPRRLTIVTTAASRLLQQGRPREALHLVSSWGADWRDSAELVNIILNALLRLGDRRAFEDELRLQMARAKSDQKLAQIVEPFLRRIDVQLGVENPFWLLEHFWGHDHNDLGDKIQDMRADPARWATVRPSLLNNIYGLREEPSLGRPEFDARVHWGLAVFNYIVFLRYWRSRLRTGGAQAGLTEDGAGRLMRLGEQIPKLFLTPDPRLFDEAKARGTPILICCAHAGMETQGLGFTHQLGMPTATVAGTPTSGNPGHISVVTSAPDIFQQFLRLVKVLKREQRVVVIFPDGAHGEARRWELLGRKVPIGTGTSLIAHQTGASVFFAQSRWDGRAFVMEMVEGPRARGGVPREDYEAEFADFFLARLRDIILGAPDDMIPKQGFWSHFT